MKILFLGGNWIENIKESGYINKLHAELEGDIIFQNGGTAEQLEEHLNSVKEYDVVLWFINVPNTYEKTVHKIKEINKKVILVTSKNNLDSKYSYMELVSRMLSVKSNLMLEFRRADGKIVGSILDPLNNAYCMKEPDIHKVATTLMARINSLMSFTRVGSKQVGEALPIPEEIEFFEIGKHLAETFHTLVHPEHTERFLGNMSFRCENGFPSFRRGNYVYVSRRNIDKRLIGKDGFVAVNIPLIDTVEYYGSAKPSVDTPIQIMLYSIYFNVNYMIHSHVYIKDIPTTNSIVPCGSLEEVAEIGTVWKNHSYTNFAINLRGHGSLVFASDLNYFSQIKYIARPCPEIQ